MTEPDGWPPHALATKHVAVAAEPTLRFVYRNWRGEIRERRVRPLRVWFGKTDWHPVEQWFMEAIDDENGEKRDFAVSEILTFEPERHRLRGASNAR